MESNSQAAEESFTLFRPFRCMFCTIAKLKYENSSTIIFHSADERYYRTSYDKHVDYIFFNISC